MINCPECNTNIKENVITCPKCGYPIKQKSNNTAIIITSIACLVISLITIIADIQYEIVSSLLFMIFPIFIIINLLKEKQIVKNKILTYTIDGITILYLGYKLIKITINLLSVFELFAGFKHILILTNVVTLILNYTFLIIMIIGLLNIKGLKFIKENINTLYYLQIATMIIYFFTTIYVYTIFGHKVFGTIISTTIDTSFFILLSTYVKLLNQREVSNGVD